MKPSSVSKADYGSETGAGAEAPSHRYRASTRWTYWIFNGGLVCQRGVGVLSKVLSIATRREEKKKQKKHTTFA